MDITKQKPLAPLSTFGIGGKAQYYTQASKPEEIIKAISWAKENNIEYTIIAGGSNIIFPDNTLSGLLIQIKGGEIKETGNLELTVDAGVNLQKVIDLANSLGLKGLETLAGIPGTVGGAVVGNAGAYGKSISETVHKVAAWNGKTKEILDKNECAFSYRDSIFKHQNLLVLNVVLKFKEGSTKNLSQKSFEIIKVREKKYSPELKCPGSFFKNVLVDEVSEDVLDKIDEDKIIEGKIPAGYLLEEVGAKGMVSGGVQVASFHGNVLINKGHGTREDVRKLADELRKRVLDRFGVELKEEIRYL